MQAAPAGSTPTMRVPGCRARSQVATPASRPAAADRHDQHVGRPAELADDLHRHRALAGDGHGVVEGGDEDPARWPTASATAARLASS